MSGSSWSGLVRVGLLTILVTAPVVWAQDTAADRIQKLERQLNDQKRALQDWGGLIHYGSDNSELRAPAAGEERVIFFGDQITEYWGRDDNSFFPGKPWLNRGIAGQTTDQMLIRFRQDVISLHPKVVVILAGINDVAGLHGPSSEETILDNLTSMTELAQANGIHVVLASVTPVCDCFTKSTARRRWQERISEVNELMGKYCRRSGAIYLDYYSAMADDDDLKKELTKDGVLPNDAGYRIMAPLAERAIATALRKRGVQ
jgi:lysophospholipase L1-like esterase